ncbi:MAG: hypothetical protein ACE5HU_06055 [Acidobacteriota bacterium]
MKMASRWQAWALVPAILVSSLSAAVARSRGPVEAIQAESDIPEERLLDVGIEVFDPGLPDEDEDALEKKGIFAAVRKSEARYIPFQLKDTLEGTGQWGAVRVVPPGSRTADVTVSGKIIHSTGLELELRILVVDARGRRWWRERKYKEEADPEAYDPENLEQADPYQGLYNRIANDMLSSRERLYDEDIQTIRRITRLRFDKDLAPAAFRDYLRVNKKGRYTIVKLPAADAPMVARMEAIRDRDDMFIDTLNEYYADFHTNMREHYDGWRQFSFEEESALREVRRKARRRKILGGLLIFTGVVLDTSDSPVGGLGDAAIIGGVAVIQNGVQKAKEAKIHVDAMQELAASFDSEISPVLVRVQGKTLKLQGSAEAQYAEWRDLLRQIFATETGLPVNPNDDDTTAASGRTEVD